MIPMPARLWQGESTLLLGGERWHKCTYDPSRRSFNLPATGTDF